MIKQSKVFIVCVGTNTEVGKTYVSAKLAKHIKNRGISVSARKLAQSYEASSSSPTDAVVLASSTGEEPTIVCPESLSFPVPMAPPMASEKLGKGKLFLSNVLSAHVFARDASVTILETAGGVRSPQTHDADAVDVVKEVRASLILVVAKSGLGCITEVRSTLDSLEKISVPKIVFLNFFDPVDELHTENLRWLKNVYAIQVFFDIKELGDVVCASLS